MPNELLKLFDFQRFQNNKKMTALLSEVEKRYKLNKSVEKELSDDDLDIFAAGDLDSLREKSNDESK